MGAAPWVNPTALNYVTSPFNPDRVHPVHGFPMPHTGTDYRAPTGTDLRAVTDGVVTRSLYSPDVAGHYVRVDVGGGVWVGYSHLSHRAVAVGERVTTGQSVGLAGATGAVTGPHLHFEVCVAGTKVDPVPYLAARTAPPPPPSAPPYTPEEDPMFILTSPATPYAALFFPNGLWSLITDGADIVALEKSGVPVTRVSAGTYTNLTAAQNKLGV